MGTEDKESCSQRDSAERTGYVRAHRSFNRIWKERDSAEPDILGKILDKDNLNRAYKRVKANKGAPGVDGMTIEAALPWLKEHNHELTERIRRGKYTPSPVRRVEIPKPDGGIRKLGIPTVIDRIIQQAMLQQLMPIYEPLFSDDSFGYRPGRGAKDAIRKIKEYIVPHNAVSEVSRKCEIKEGSGNARFNVVAIDCGMKQSIVKRMTEKGCKVTVVPYNTPAEEIEKKHPDGIFISNGPGDPTDVTEVIETVRKLKGKYPIFGICLGHQIIALAYGAKTYKLKFGHRGGNHPVKNLKTGKTEITSQNHSYAVDAESLGKTPLSITHINLLDGTVEGMECEKDRIFSVQYHPESAPGPEDSTYLFDRFVRLMEDTENAEEN